MTLETQTQNRIPPQRLINLTNVTTGAAAIDAAKLTEAANDAKADLEVYAGVAYDETDPRIVAAAVRGVVLYLLSYKGESRSEPKLKEWQEVQLDKHLRMVTGNDRIPPRSTSELTPTEETQGGEIVRPFFDNNALDDIIPEFRPSSRRRRFFRGSS